jgi:hypothetical protein
MMAEKKHAAKAWVEEWFPSITGNHKAALILAYGAGLDAGLAEAQELVAVEIERAVIRGSLGLPLNPYDWLLPDTGT